MASTKSAPKDPGIAALISVVGLLLLGAPAIGYFYLGNVRKGIVYLLALWAAAAIAFGISVGLTILTFGFGLCLMAPIGLLLLAFGLLIVWDVYLIAQGKKPKLPEF